MPSKVFTKGQTTAAIGARPPRKRPRTHEPQVSRSDSGTETHDLEVVREDDVCPICQQLLYRPVTTKCKHTLCHSCMQHWADASTTSQMVIVSLNDDPNTTKSSALSARCPMCRTSSTASLNTKLHRSLRSQYPGLYRERGAEEQPTGDISIETLTLYIGNSHRLRPRNPDEDYETSNIHDWTFFVRPAVSLLHIIEEVQIFLHPSFRTPRIIRTMAPYEVRRLGWGTFTITAHVILKAGYSWISEEAVRAPDGAEKGMLTLDWKLDFEGRGKQGRCTLKVKSEAWAEERAEEERRETERGRVRMRRAYESDGNWMPPPEE